MALSAYRRTRVGLYRHWERDSEHYCIFSPGAFAFRFGRWVFSYDCSVWEWPPRFGWGMSLKAFWLGHGVIIKWRRSAA